MNPYIAGKLHEAKAQEFEARAERHNFAQQVKQSSEAQPGFLRRIWLNPSLQVKAWTSGQEARTTSTMPVFNQQKLQTEESFSV